MDVYNLRVHKVKRIIETKCVILGSFFGVSFFVVKVFVQQTNICSILAIKTLDTVAEDVQSSL